MINKKTETNEDDLKVKEDKAPSPPAEEQKEESKILDSFFGEANDKAGRP